MKKVLKLLPILLFCITATGCRGGKAKTPSSEPEEPPFGTEPFVYQEIEEVPIDVKKEGCEILYINIVNIPATGIKVACWDEYNIKFDVTYNDTTTEQFPFLTKHFPVSSRHYLGELGHHNIEMVVNNTTTKFGFDIIKNPDFNGYDCVFIDSRTGEQIYKTVVGYYKTAVFGGDVPANIDKEHEVINTFVGWNYPLQYVHQNMVYTTHYRDIEKRFYGNGVHQEENPVISTVNKDDSKFVLAYLGRVCAVPINYGGTIYHVKGEESNNLHFKKINPYSEMWNEANQSIFNNTLKYSFNASAAQYLFGNNSSFNANPTFLSNFDSMYTVGGAQLMRLDNGLMVYISNNPGFKKCYDYAAETAGESKYINSYDDTGYYRLALTVTFDIYVSLEFKKLSNDKYSLNGASEFFFAPVDNSVFIRKQYSENGVFGNYFNKTINYSNETFLNIARSLDWGNA